MGAFLEGVRVVKLSAWEPEVHMAVQRARTKELAFIRMSSFFMAGNRALMDAAPVIVALFSFALYAWSGECVCGWLAGWLAGWMGGCGCG